MKAADPNANPDQRLGSDNGKSTVVHNSQQAGRCLVVPPNAAVQYRLTLNEIFELDATLPAAVQQIEHLQYEASKLVLGGDSNLGKTWVELNASIAVAGGKKVWDRFSTHQGPTVFFACEGMFRLTIDAIAKVARGLGIEKPNEVPFELRFREQIRLSVRTWRQSLIKEIKAMEAVRVTFDPIAMAATFNELRPESWKEEVFDPIDHIIDETGAAVVLPHHVSQLSLTEKGIPARAALRGSTSLPAWADSILVMREAKDGLLMEHAKMRGGPKLGDLNVTIAFAGDTVRVVCEESGSRTQRKAEIDEAIMNALADRDTLTQGALETEVRCRVGGATSQTIRARIRHSITEGTIVDAGGGSRGKAHRYQLAEDTR